MGRIAGLGWCVAVVAALQASALDLAIKTEPYLTSGLYVNPLLPLEGRTVRIQIEIPWQGSAKPPVCAIAVLDPSGGAAFETRIQLAAAKDAPSPGVAEGVAEWTAGRNGVYRVRAVLDPDNVVKETDEGNNTAEIALPVLVKGRRLFFPWYTPASELRWCNVVTSVKGEDAPGLAKRGIRPLAWEYGGMSWSYFDNSRFDTEPEKAKAELEELFHQKYARPDIGATEGFGIDETGGYPGTAAYSRSVASMRALAVAKREHPERFFAVWHGGGLWSTELAGLYRQGADLLLLETYIWRAIPDDLGAEDVYQQIRDRIDPIVRSTDMICPAYGNPCHTLVALDTVERVDRVSPDEQEQVVRFIRRICPEMRGIAFYNSGYGGYGLERSEDTDRKRDLILRTADRLCFEYYIKPCLTFQAESLWLGRDEGAVRLTAAVSNIGGVDSGPVRIRMWDGNRSLGEVQLESVPAGPNRNQNRAYATLRAEGTPGKHLYRAEIVEAAGSTILDGEIAEARVL